MSAHGVNLRRRARHGRTSAPQPTGVVANACDEGGVAVPIVFRTHNDAVSCHPFVFCPRNFGLCGVAAAQRAVPQSLPAPSTAVTPSVAGAATACGGEGTLGCTGACGLCDGSAGTYTTRIEAVLELRECDVQGDAMRTSATRNVATAATAADTSAVTSITLACTSTTVAHTREAVAALSGNCGDAHLAVSHVATPNVCPTTGGDGDASISISRRRSSSSSAGAAAPLRAAAPLAANELSVAATMTPLSANTSTHGWWICRAVACTAKEAAYSNGAVSVHQSLASQCPQINKVTNGATVCRVLHSYADVQARYGLSHVEVCLEHQYVSRADMYVIAAALRERIVYAGEELQLCGCRLRVSDLLRCCTQPLREQQPPPPHYKKDVHDVSARASCAGDKQYARVWCGVVTAATCVNYRSLSPHHCIVIELSREMWSSMVDGRSPFSWALRQFLSEWLHTRLPQHKASPHLRVVITGRLQRAYTVAGEVDVMHTLDIAYAAATAGSTTTATTTASKAEATVAAPSAAVVVSAHAATHTSATSTSSRVTTRAVTTVVNVVDEIMSHCVAFVRRVLRETALCDSAGTTNRKQQHVDAMDGGCDDGCDDDMAAALRDNVAREVFVRARHCNTLDVLALLAEQFAYHHLDRALHNTGHALTVVSAGKAVYVVRRWARVQQLAARLYDTGVDRVSVVCLGRPPMHVSPLLVYNTADPTLRSQYHLYTCSTNATRVEGSHSSTDVCGCDDASVDDEARDAHQTRHASCGCACRSPQASDNDDDDDDRDDDDGNHSSVGEHRSNRTSVRVYYEKPTWMRALYYVPYAQDRRQPLVSHARMQDMLAVVSSCKSCTRTMDDASSATAAATSSSFVLLTRKSWLRQEQVWCCQRRLRLRTHSCAHLQLQASCARWQKQSRCRATSVRSAPTATSHGAADNTATSSKCYSGSSSSSSSSSSSCSSTTTASSNRSCTRRRCGSGATAVLRPVYVVPDVRAPLLLPPRCGARTSFAFAQSPRLRLPRSTPAQRYCPSVRVGSVCGGRCVVAAGQRLAHTTPSCGKNDEGSDSHGCHGAPSLVRVLCRWHRLCERHASAVMAMPVAAVVDSDAVDARGAREQHTAERTQQSLPLLQRPCKQQQKQQEQLTATAAAAATVTSVRVQRYATPCASVLVDNDLARGALVLELTLSCTCWCACRRTNGDANPCATEASATARKDVLHGELPDDGDDDDHRGGRRCCYAWSPLVLGDDAHWQILMSCFTGSDDRTPTERLDGATWLHRTITRSSHRRRSSSSSSRSSDNCDSGDDATHITNVSATANAAAAAVDASACVGGDSVQRCTRRARTAAPFCAADVFCRASSALLHRSTTLRLATRANNSMYAVPTRVHLWLADNGLVVPQARVCSARGGVEARAALRPQPALAVSLAHDGTPRCAARLGEVVVAHIQLRDHLRFAITPIDPMRSRESDSDDDTSAPMSDDDTSDACVCDARGQDNDNNSSRSGSAPRCRQRRQQQQQQQQQRALSSQSPLGDAGGADAGSLASPSSWSSLRSWTLPWGTEAVQSVSTTALFRRRWHHRHPTLPRTHLRASWPHDRAWSLLCSCAILPLYGVRATYSPECFVTVPTHRYSLIDRREDGGKTTTGTMPRAAAAGSGTAVRGSVDTYARVENERGGAETEVRRRLRMFVLQRLQQQYQIILTEAYGVDAADAWLSLRASSETAPTPPLPHLRMEMSVGHQTHVLTLSESGDAVAVTRTLHRGVYGNRRHCAAHHGCHDDDGAVAASPPRVLLTTPLSSSSSSSSCMCHYALWNYLDDTFEARRVPSPTLTDAGNAHGDVDDVDGEDDKDVVCDAGSGGSGSSVDTSHHTSNRVGATIHGSVGGGAAVGDGDGGVAWERLDAWSQCYPWRAIPRDTHTSTLCVREVAMVLLPPPPPLTFERQSCEHGRYTSPGQAGVNVTPTAALDGAYDADERDAGGCSGDGLDGVAHGGGSSTHTRTRRGDERPHALRGVRSAAAPAMPPFSSFSQFITTRFSVHLYTLNHVEWYDNVGALRFVQRSGKGAACVLDVDGSGTRGRRDVEACDGADMVRGDSNEKGGDGGSGSRGESDDVGELRHATPACATMACTTRLATAILVQDPSHACGARVDGRRDVAGQAVCAGLPIDDRVMSLNAIFTPHYHRRCCYTLHVRWLQCVASVVADWCGAYTANATRHGMRAVPLTCNRKHHPVLDAFAVYHAVVDETPHTHASRDTSPLCATLLHVLTRSSFAYYPEAPATLQSGSRLVHITGLCYVVLAPAPCVVALWCPNTLVQRQQQQQQQQQRQGMATHKALLLSFQCAVQLARQLRTTPEATATQVQASAARCTAAVG